MTHVVLDTEFLALDTSRTVVVSAALTILPTDKKATKVDLLASTKSWYFSIPDQLRHGRIAAPITEPNSSVAWWVQQDDFVFQQTFRDKVFEDFSTSP